jgi:hypothetical protein
MECWEQDIAPVGPPGERGAIEWALTAPTTEGVYTVYILNENKMSCATALENGYSDDAMELGVLKVLYGAESGVATLVPTGIPSATEEPTLLPTPPATELLFVATPSEAPTIIPTQHWQPELIAEPKSPHHGHNATADDDHMQSNASMAIAIAIGAVVFVCMGCFVWLFSSRAGNIQEEEEPAGCKGTPCAGTQIYEDDEGKGDEYGEEEHEGSFPPVSAMHTQQINMLHQLNKQGVISDLEFTQKLSLIVGVLGSPDNGRPDGRSPISPSTHGTPHDQRRAALFNETAATQQTVVQTASPQSRREAVEPETNERHYGAYGASPLPRGAHFY